MKTDKIAVIDIGSNSMRLVLYQRIAHEWWPLVNEKATCRLGEDLAKTGKLSPQGWRKAEAALARFAWIVNAHDVRECQLLGTAALRQAKDSQAFCAMITKNFGWQVKVLTGQEEAYYAAQSVTCYVPEVSGYCADLGGSSCEIAYVPARPTQPALSVAVGIFDANNKNALAMIRSELKSTVLPTLADKRLFVIGGTWRALAHVYMHDTNYPLEDSHHLTVNWPTLEIFLEKVAGMDTKLLKSLPHVSKIRAPYLPFAARVLQTIIQTLNITTVSFWNKGIREGYLYSYHADALIHATESRLAQEADAYAASMGRDVSVQPLLAWLAPLEPFMPHTLVKLWPAAVMLSDIAQFEHDDHREYVAFTKILYAPLLSATHAERFFLAMAIFARYAGSLDDEWLVRYKPFLPEAWLKPALALGQALRLAKVLCAGCHDILPHCPLVVKNGHLNIVKTPQSPPLEGDVVDKRLKNLQKTLQSMR